MFGSVVDKSVVRIFGVFDICFEVFDSDVVWGVDWW